MQIFPPKAIQQLFTYKYPSCCSEWNSFVEINTFGIMLKKFSLTVNDRQKQLRHALRINELLGANYTQEELEESLDEYLRLLVERRQKIRKTSSSWFYKLLPVPSVSTDNDGVWGSKRQYLCGIVTSHILKHDTKTTKKILPFMCVALNPTGGICGAGNQSLYKGSVYSSLIVHSCLHDASGYCYNYHGTGHGYNYLNTWFALPTKFAISCQVVGICKCVYYKYRSSWFSNRVMN